MADASSKASLILEVIDLDAYRSAVRAATTDTEALTAAQAAVKPIQAAAAKATREKAEVDKEAAKAAKELADAEKMVEKAYISALAPHEKTALVLEKTLDLQFDSVEMTSKQAVAVAHLSLKLEDQTRRFEMNRGSQHKLSRSLAELLDEQTKAQVAAVAAGAAMLKEGLSSQKLTLAIEHLKDTTSEADKKTETYTKQVEELEEKLEEVTAAEKATTSAVKDHAEEQILAAIVGEKYAGVIKKTDGGLRAAAIGAGLAVAGTAALAVGALAAVTAIVAVSSAADEWNHELRAVGLNLDAIGTSAVNRAAAGIDSISVVAKLLGVTIAEKMAPAVEDGATLLVALGLAAVDTINTLGDGEGIVRAFANVVGKGLAAALMAPLAPGRMLLEQVIALKESFGLDTSADMARQAFLDDLEAITAKRFAAGLADLAASGIKPLVAATTDYMAKARELVLKQEAINRATRAQTDAVVEATTAWELYQNKAVGANSEVLKATEKTAAGMASANKGAFDEIKAASASATAAEEANAERFAAFMVAQTTAVLGQVGALAGSVMSLTNLAEDGMTKMWKAMFVVQKAAALSSIAVSTAANISAAALAFAFPSPAGIAAVAAVAALGALQAATVAVSAFGEYKGAQTSAGGGSSGGGGASTSAGSSGGGSLSLGGGGGFMSSQASSGPASYGGGGPAPLAIPSSDGYFPPTMGGRTIQTAPGDEAYVQRGGALNRSNQGGDGGGFNAEIASLLRALLTEAKGGRQDSRMRLHFAAATGPARGY